MAKIIESIEGYADMTPEQKLAAIEALETPAPDYTGYVKKDVLDAKAKEAAELSRKLKEKMTEEEQKEAERAATAKALQEELETLRKEKTVSAYVANFLSLGYDEKLANETAAAMAEGKTETVFANQKKFLEAQKQAFVKQTLEGTPRPPAGNPDGASITKEQFNEMGYSERLKLCNEQPTLYKQLTGGTE